MHVFAAGVCSAPVHKNGAHPGLEVVVVCVQMFQTHLALINKVEDTHALLLCKLCCSICQLLRQLLHIITAEPDLVAEFELQPCCRIPGSVPALIGFQPLHKHQGMIVILRAVAALQQHPPDMQLH